MILKYAAFSVKHLYKISDFLMCFFKTTDIIKVQVRSIQVSDIAGSAGAFIMTLFLCVVHACVTVKLLLLKQRLFAILIFHVDIFKSLIHQIGASLSRS